MTTGTQGSQGQNWMQDIQQLEKLPEGQFHVEYRPSQALQGSSDSGSVQPITVDARNFQDCVSQLASKAKPYINR